MKKIIFTVNLLLVAIITSAQVAYWPLNGDAIDFSGAGNDGIIDGATIASDVNGIPGGALHFTSGNEITFSEDPFIIENQITFSFWIKISPMNSNERLFNKRSCSVDGVFKGLFVLIKEGKLRFGYTPDGNKKITFEFNSLQNYDDNQWHHVVIVFNGSELKLDFYKDGILDVNHVLTNSIIMNSDMVFTISHEVCGLTNTALDEVKIFDYAISDVDVQQIYSEGVPASPAVAGEISGNNSVCPGDVNVVYSVSPIEGATGYVWDLPAGATISSGANTESINVDFSSSAVSGNISVYGTNDQFNGASSNLNINVGKPESAGAIDGINFVALGDIVTYSISEVVGAIDYEWELSGIATIISGENTNTIEVNISSSSGIIKVTPINNCGSGTSSSLMVTVGDITTSGPITINPFLADNNYLLFKTNETNLGIIGSDAKLYSGGNSDNLGMYVYGDNNLEFSTNNTKRLAITGSGDVGIGTTSPSEKLTVVGNITLTENASLINLGEDGASGPHGFIFDDPDGSQLKLVYRTTPNQLIVEHTDTGEDIFSIDATNDFSYFKGNLGIGTATPLGKVDILAATDEVALRLSMPTSEDAAAYDIKWANSNADVVHRIQYSSTYYDFMNVNRATRNVSFNGGNVSIGTTTIPIGYKLAVNGKIIAIEIQVEADWADFVFESTYKLMPLKELDNYIQENKHLPEIPTTEEVKENGISIGEMNAKLLQKIEELTLYTIQQQYLINNQQELIEVLKSGMETQNKRIEQIENK